VATSDAAILKAIKSHPIYKSSQITLKTDDQMLHQQQIISLADIYHTGKGL
jgi:hypothetical protein